MLVGPTATAAEIEAFRAHIIASPERFIAQPTLALSTCPTLTAKGLAPRHVDLRPFILTGATGSTIVDRKGVGAGKGVSVRVDLGGCGMIKKKQIEIQDTQQ